MYDVSRGMETGSMLSANAQFWQNGLSVRELRGGPGTGFVIRVLSGEGGEAQILSMVRQPGHATVVGMAHHTEYAHHPQSPLTHRYYARGNFRPVEPEIITEQIRARIVETPLAALALRYL